MTCARSAACGLALALCLGMSAASPGTAAAALFSVDGTATIEVDTAGGGGIALAWPIQTASDFSAGVHVLDPAPVGTAATEWGAVSSPLFRLPQLDELRVGASWLRTGQVARAGTTTGLEFDLGSFEISGRDSGLVGGVELGETETLAFASVELGSAAGPQPGELRTELADLADASLSSALWTIASNTLDIGGNGTVVLEAPITLTSSLQPGLTIDGEARLALTFVPEPNVFLALAAGSALLTALPRRRSARRRNT